MAGTTSHGDRSALVYAAARAVMRIARDPQHHELVPGLLFECMLSYIFVVWLCVLVCIVYAAARAVILFGCVL